jgi:Rieske Fe-S protein
MANPTSRRTVLAGLGTAAAATALAACSTGSGGSGASADSGGNTSAGASTPNSTGGTSSGNATLGNTSDIPVGGGKIFDQQQVVVTQPTQGQLKCFTAVCTHMGCIVHDVSGGTINCVCHGSKYSINDGSVVNGPAPKPLATEQITVSDGAIKLGK